MKYTITIILAFSINFNVHSCLNEYHTLKNGIELYDIDDFSVGIKKHWETELDTVELIEKSKEFWEKYLSTDSVEYYSDYAITLTYLGELNKAKGIFLEIESIRPDLYTTAANLGTVYELLGQNDSALYWIKKGIELNPDSHEGSEWIHLKILEYKILHGESTSVSVLGLNFGNEKMPKNIMNYNLSEFSNDIIYQLKERTLFVKPPNDIVGSIYFDLGNIMFIKHPEGRKLTWIKSYFKAAESYGFTSPLFEKRMKFIKELSEECARKKDKPKPYNLTLVIIVGLILIAICGVIILRKKRATNS